MNLPGHADKQTHVLFYDIEGFLLGHGNELQVRDCKLFPTHGVPPKVSLTKIDLILSCFPPSHVAEHAPHSPKSSHSQCAI